MGTNGVYIVLSVATVMVATAGKVDLHQKG